MLSEFDNDSSAIDFIHEQNPEQKDHSEKMKLQRKLSKLYVILYQVYTMARFDK